LSNGSCGCRLPPQLPRKRRSKKVDSGQEMGEDKRQRHQHNNQPASKKEEEEAALRRTTTDKRRERTRCPQSRWTAQWQW
jgi:hypothetical protein